MFCIKFPFAKSLTTILIFFFAVIASCKNINRNNSHPEISNSEISAGKDLAEEYCQSCHSLPDPSLLNSASWEKGVLPQMGPRLGIFSFNFIQYPVIRDLNFSTGFYPSKPVLKPEEWKDILAYYMAVAPDSLSEKSSAGDHINSQLSLFSLLEPTFKYDLPATTLVQFAKDKGETNVLVSDARKQVLYKCNNALHLIDSVKTSGPIVSVEQDKQRMVSCNIGILNPNTGKFGSGRMIVEDAKGKLKNDSASLFNGLERPVQISASDLNNDGKTDYLVCEFGYQTGALSWMENLGNNKFSRHVLRPLPGALKAYIQDYNHDGLQDFWVLFAQGEEGIFLFTNKGNGQFEQKEVLRFPPVYGSSYFEFADFNKDGYPDIVYTCGDNADYSLVLKPYHGVYIFMNDGKNNFHQQYFFHINGCYKAIARDFDNDGDLDIATIAFFPDFVHKPEEGFIYLENKGQLKFDPYTLPALTKGRWLTMDAGDINGDGKTDLVLGNFSIGPTTFKPKYDWKKGPPFIVLENLGKNKLNPPASD